MFVPHLKRNLQMGMLDRIKQKYQEYSEEFETIFPEEMIEVGEEPKPTT